MRVLRHRTTASVVATLLVVASTAALATDENCSEWECDVMRKVAGMTEEPDPLQIWNDVNEYDLVAEVNPGGDARNDGAPNILLDPATGSAIAVWAYNNQTDHDIAFREWLGLGWGPLTFLSSGFENELDPRLAIDADGTLHVAWWVADRDEVVLTTRRAATGRWTWNRVIQLDARRPSLVVDGGTLLLSFERGRVGGGQEVVVLSLADGIVPTQQVVAWTPRNEPLDARLHKVGSSLWVDWKHSSTSFGYSRLRYGFWDPRVATMPWTNPSWIGQERVRSAILDVVLGLN